MPLGRGDDVVTMPRIVGVVLSLAFLGIASLAGSLTHSPTVFVAVMAVGLVVRLVLRIAG
jgi:hypothetical protein